MLSKNLEMKNRYLVKLICILILLYMYVFSVKIYFPRILSELIGPAIL